MTVTGNISGVTSAQNINNIFPALQSKGQGTNNNQNPVFFPQNKDSFQKSNQLVNNFLSYSPQFPTQKTNNNNTKQNTQSTAQTNSNNKSTANTQSSGTSTVSDQNQQKIKDLQSTDRKVRAHELAHLAAAAGLANSGINYTYTTGPDGKQYVTGGDVTITMSYNPNNPEEGIKIMEQVQRAALAPVDPSPQDRAVAAKAAAIEAELQLEENQNKAKEAASANPTSSKAISAYNNTQNQNNNTGNYINVLIGATTGGLNQ